MLSEDEPRLLSPLRLLTLLPGHLHPGDRELGGTVAGSALQPGATAVGLRWGLLTQPHPSCRSEGLVKCPPWADSVGRAEKPSRQARVHGWGSQDLARGGDLPHIPLRVWQNWDRNPGLLAPPALSTTLLCLFFCMCVWVFFAELP